MKGLKLLKLLSTCSTYPSSETLCHLLLLLHPTVTSALRSLDRIKMFRVQYAVVTSTVSGEINIFSAYRLLILILLIFVPQAVFLKSIHVLCAAPFLKGRTVRGSTSMYHRHTLSKQPKMSQMIVKSRTFCLSVSSKSTLWCCCCCYSHFTVTVQGVLFYFDCSLSSCGCDYQIEIAK